MTGARIEQRLSGFEEAAEFLSRLVAQGQNTTPLMDEIGAAMVASTVRRFETETDPDGNKWLPSIRALEEGGQTLTDRGLLRQSMTHNASEARVEWGTNLIHGAIHQFGGTIRPKVKDRLKFRLPGGGYVSVEQVTIPARPFLGIDADDEAEILAIVSDWIAGAGAGGEAFA